ncbi:MAG TPA: hypothetical protein VGL97_05115 [Bryobacteraceae bacterium]
MSAPLVPSPLDYIGRRRFAFYPAIKNAEPNDWRLGSGSWSEVQVVNTQTGREIWIPRQYIGAVSDGSGPLLIVGLRKALDFRSGSLQPRVKRVIEMPPFREEPFGFEPASARPAADGPARVVAIRLERRKKSPVLKAIIGLAISALLTWLLFGFDWEGCSHSGGLCAISSR